MRFLATTALITALAASPVRAIASDQLEISSVGVRLFLGYSGTLSHPLTKADVLRNTTIGEGSASEPSSSVLIDVIVSGPLGSFDAHRAVTLVAADSSTGKVVGRFTKGPGVLSSAGAYHVAFWLPDTGCVPLHLVARVRGTSRSRTADVPFRCAE
jgi:hypothetical protein